MDRFNEPISAAKLLREPFAGEPLTCECPHCGRKLLTMAGAWVQCDEEDPRRTIVEGLERACSCEVARVASITNIFSFFKSFLLPVSLFFQ